VAAVVTPDKNETDYIVKYNESVKLPMGKIIKRFREKDFSLENKLLFYAMAFFYPKTAICPGLLNR
jgi:hypothetical protein